MNRRALVLALTLASSGLGCSALEPREAEAANGNGCALLNPYGAARPGAERFYRYRTRVDLGDPLPRSISTRGGGATQT